MYEEEDAENWSPQCPALRASDFENAPPEHVDLNEIFGEDYKAPHMPEPSCPGSPCSSRRRNSTRSSVARKSLARSSVARESSPRTLARSSYAPSAICPATLLSNQEPYDDDEYDEYDEGELSSEAPLPEGATTLLSLGTTIREGQKADKIIRRIVAEYMVPPPQEGASPAAICETIEEVYTPSLDDWE